MGFDQAVALRVGFKMIRCFYKWNPRLLSQRLTNTLAKLRMRIDTTADGSPTHGQFIHCPGSDFGPLDRKSYLPCKPSEFLSQSQRSCIHQVGSPNLDDLVPILGLL